jgi:predicted DNA-binding transcriptional regulator YafY
MTRTTERREVPPGKPARIAKVERLLNLVAFLLSVNEPIPFSQMKGRVIGYDDEATHEALEKRFDRDKAELRAMGIPIEFTPADAMGRPGYYIPKDEYYLREIDFTVEEAMLLSILTHLVADDPRGPVAGNLRSALQKVAIDSPIAEPIRASVAEQHLFDLKLSPSTGLPARNLATIQSALQKRIPVRFTYHGLKASEPSPRIVEPWGMGNARAEWYLSGLSRERNAERMFRLSRIQGAVKLVVGETFEVPSDFDMGDRLAREAWEFGEGKPTRVRIRIAPNEAWMFEENLREGETFKWNKDGSGILTIDATQPQSVLEWIAKRGAAAVIVQPPSLRKNAVDWFQRTLARYE